MPSNKRIEHFQFIKLPYTRADEMIKMTSEFIAELAITCDVSMFQSAFGFMNNDIPFTMLIQRNKLDTNTFEVSLEVNDWGTFGIEDDDLFPAKEWHLRGSSNRLQVPYWEDLTAYEIYQKISVMYRNDGFVTISGEDATQLIDMITMMLMEVYVDGMEPNDWPCDIIEAHVAMIYSEKYNEAAKNFSEHNLYTEIVEQFVHDTENKIDKIVFDCFQQHLGCKNADDVLAIVTSPVMFHRYNDILPYINETIAREIGSLGSPSGECCIKFTEMTEPAKRSRERLETLRRIWEEVYNEN